MLIIAAITISVCSAIIELASIFFLDKRLTREHDWIEERGTIGEQFGEWLLASETEDSPTNLDVITSRAATSFYRSQNASLAGMKSGEVRHFQKVDQDVFENIVNSNADVKFIASLLEKAGLGDYVNPKDLPYIIKKFGRQLLGNNGRPTSSGHGSRFKY